MSTLIIWVSLNLWVLVGAVVLYNLTRFRPANVVQSLGACLAWPIVLVRDKIT
jgi:hypothetical protein